MKSLEQLDSWITAKVRTWSGKVSGVPQSTELLEIRRDILNDVRDHIQAKGEGKSLFPYSTISIHIAAEDSRQHALLEQAFTTDNDLEQTISALLTEAGCPPPAGFRVIVSVFEGADLASTTRPFRVDYLIIKPAVAQEIPNTRPRARLVIIRGQAESIEYDIDSDRINVGRLKEVISDKDGLRRRNDIAFAETETTVSREHAFIRYDYEIGKFRLYDSMSHRGTSVFREGRRFEVPKSSTRGFQLRSGDEIHLGDARLRFDMEDAAPL